MIDRNGTILLQHPLNEKMDKKQATKSNLVKAMLSRHEGLIETKDFDGKQRVYSFTPVTGTGNSIIVAAGISRDAAFAKINSSLYLNLTIIGVIAILSLSSATVIRRMAKRSANELKESEELFRLYFEMANIGIALTSPQKGWIWANRHLLKMLGYEKEELFTKNWAEMTWHEDLEEDIRQFKKVISGEIDGYDMNKRFHRKDGSLLPTHLTVACIREADASVRLIIATLDDISEREQTEQELKRHRHHLEKLVKERTENLEHKTLELERSQMAMLYLLEDINETNKQLEQANERLKEVDRLKSMFIASMSHELRTPLNSVIGFSSILLNEWIGTLNDEQKKSLTSILRSGKHLLSLINDVIDVSKIEAGMIEVSQEDFELAELLTEVEQTFAKDAQDRKFTLAVQQLNLPMHTDRRRLLQCLLNLVSNALKFTEKGEVTVEVLHDERKRELTIAVTDTGIGIKMDDQPKLFQAFSRIQSHLTATVFGTGLGLYLTKRIIVDILQGEIKVASESGVGSTFTITIPVRVESAG